jgi:hypothetical protein
MNIHRARTESSYSDARFPRETLKFRGADPTSILQTFDNTRVFRGTPVAQVRVTTGPIARPFNEESA